MSNQQLSTSSGDHSFALSQQKNAQKTIAQLIDDENALEQWSSNVEKIRRSDADNKTPSSS